MKFPEVSVVIPAYNCAHMIGEAIESALGQEIDLEVIVVDDCSSDHLDQVMDSYADNPSVIYVKNARNLGAAQSRNKGISLARGKYVAFLDGDDCWRPGKLRRQLERMEAAGAVLCCTARELMTPKGEHTGRIIPVRERISYRDILKENSISCSSVLIRKDIAMQFPMDYEDSHEDYITWMKVLQKYQFAVGINEPFLLYRLSASGKSGNKLKSAAMTFRAYRYMGFGLMKSLICFAHYAVNGVRKYLFSYFNRK